MIFLGAWRMGLGCSGKIIPSSPPPSPPLSPPPPSCKLAQANLHCHERERGRETDKTYMILYPSPIIVQLMVFSIFLFCMFPVLVHLGGRPPQSASTWSLPWKPAVPSSGLLLFGHRRLQAVKISDCKPSVAKMVSCLSGLHASAVMPHGSW